MTVAELVAKLASFDQQAQVRVMSSHDKGDDVTDWNITDVHDGWTLNEDHDMVSIEIDFDQRPGFLK